MGAVEFISSEMYVVAVGSLSFEMCVGQLDLSAQRGWMAKLCQP